jgi:DNA-binding CsgD family transcriptional regulator
MIVHPRSQTEGAMSLSVRSDPTQVALYDEHWSRFDPWARSLGGLTAASGTVMNGDALVEPREFRRTAFFHEFGLRNHVTQALTCFVEASDERVAVVSVNRGEHHPRFGRAETATLQRIAPHLRRALAVQARLDGGPIPSPGTPDFDLTEHLAHGFMLLEPDGRIISANRAARTILDARDGLLSERGFLRASSPARHAELAALFCAHETLGTHSGEFGLQLPRPSGARPYTVVASPVYRPEAPDRRRIAVFVSDPEWRPLPPDAYLRTAWGLTAAEAALVRLLVSGRTLGDAAHDLGLQPDTVRKRLQVVFQKTDTRRQAELIQLVLAGMPPVRPSHT